MKNSIDRSHRSLSIDALRGLAVLSVVFHHAYMPFIGIYGYDVFLSFFHQYGVLGVDLFFLLSGFCIHGAYSNANQQFSPKHYLLRRWWRIYPPYFFALGLAVILNLMTDYCKWRTGGVVSLHNFGVVQILPHLFLLHDFSPYTLHGISGPFWTIAMEAQYYLLYLAVRPFFYDRKGWFFMFALALVLHFAAWSEYSSVLPFQPLSPFRYWIEWVLGAFLVYWIRRKPPVFNHKRFFYFFFFLLFFVSAVFINRLVSYPSFGVLFFAVSFAFLILFFLHLEKIWSLPAMRWLPGVGVFSYSVYLIHFLLIDRVRTLFILRAPQGWLRMASSVFIISFCVAASYLFFLFLEKPFMNKSASIPKY